MAKCKCCGKTYIKKQNRQAYCCQECRVTARRQQYRNASHKYYHKHKHEWDSIRRFGMGSGTLGPHANVDFDSEHVAVRKELVRLRLK